MSRTVCGICWCPYDDDGTCGCPPPAADAVSDAMVEAALLAINIEHPEPHETREMRAAIAAALAARGK
jgi:hypothetical protein